MGSELESSNKLLLDFAKLQSVAKTGQAVIPVVMQEFSTKEVLIVGYANREALVHTLTHKVATLWSTSRNELWIKGKTSGNTLELMEVRVNCEQNSLLYLVKLKGEGACHVKDQSGKARQGCFYRKIDGTELRFLDA